MQTSNPENRSRRLTAVEVLQRYMDECLPAFCDRPLLDVNQAGCFGERPLDVAACRGDIEEMMALLEGGADVSGEGELGNTPLHEAVGQNHLEAVKLLFYHGASTNKKNGLGQTAIDIARMHARDEIVKLLETTGGTT